jgi:orotate phosphoribosyltransferase
MDFSASVITQNIGFEIIDSIAGGETAGIPFAAWIADRLMLPMQYVRKKPKGFGRNALIEGDFKDNSQILLVEDLTTDGNSKIKFCEALREAGAKVDHTFVVFYYDIFPQTKIALDKIGLQMHSLATWWDVLEVAKEFNYFDNNAISEVESFLNNPTKWSGEHGGETS